MNNTSQYDLEYLLRTRQENIRKMRAAPKRYQSNVVPPAGSGTQRSWPYRKRWPYRQGVSVPVGYGAQNGTNAVDSSGPGTSSSFILNLQNDLADVLAISVPRNGRWDAATRRALRLFQRSVGLPMSGRPTRSTLSALKSAAARMRARTTSFDDSAAPVGNAWAPPPEAGPAPDVSGPPPSTPTGNDTDIPVSDGAVADGDQPQEEFHLASSGIVTLRHRETLALDDPNAAEKLPNKPGLYVITAGPSNLPWYVGVTEGSILERFRPRWKTLRHFNLGSSALKGRSITSYTLASIPAIQVLFRPGVSGPFRPKKGIKGILLALEEHFIRNLGTAGKGNERRSNISYANNVSVNIQIIPSLPNHPIDSKIPIKMQAPSQVQTA